MSNIELFVPHHLNDGERVGFAGFGGDILLGCEFGHRAECLFDGSRTYHSDFVLVSLNGLREVEIAVTQTFFGIALPHKLAVGIYLQRI